MNSHIATGKVFEGKRRFERAGPIAVGSLVAEATAPVFQKKGATVAALLSDWRMIAGPVIADHTMPEKLTKGAPARNDGSGAGRQPAHLLLKVAPTHALEVQYMIPQLIERINAALGYRAVSAIRLVQGPVTAPKQMHKSKAEVAPIYHGTSRLETALARMAAAIKARSVAE